MNDASQRFVAPRDAAQYAREAALIGARQAFSRPSSAAAQPQRPNASVVQLPLNGLQNGSKPAPPLPSTSSSSIQLSPTATAATQRSNSIPSLQSSGTNIATPNQLQSPSPSNIVAGAAAFRNLGAQYRSPEPFTDSSPVLRPGISRLGNFAPLASQAQPARAVQSPPSNGTSPASISSARPRKPSKPAGLESHNVRPVLTVDTPKTPANAAVQARTSSTEIHSPTPVRPVSTAASFEAATATLQSESNTADNVSNPASEPTQKPTATTEQQTRPSQARPMLPPPRPNQNNGHVATYRRPSNARTVSQSSLTPLQDDSQRIEALANAIVGAHLASSRASSPAKSPMPNWGRQNEKSQQASGPFRGHNPDSRTPSPAKRMRQTLRKPPLPEPEEDTNLRRPRGHFHLRQHPHKHHEGDRKRWRDEINYEERKRYEGVWAANKDVYMRFSPGELASPLAMERVKGYVSALVVKDIWSRSRLPPYELEEIWDLVDRQQLGRLDREEFVVGLWLIDQRLRGRKLPSKVGNSVWQSVRGIYGLKVPKRKD